MDAWLKNRFHSCSIGGITFNGVVNNEGPYLSCFGKGQSAGVALGIASISMINERHDFIPVDGRDRNGKYHLKNDVRKAWYLVKYQHLHRLSIDHFTEEQRLALASEFGLPVENNSDWKKNAAADMFIASPAFDSLCGWVTENPSLAKQLQFNDQHIPGWYSIALERRDAVVVNARTSQNTCRDQEPLVCAVSSLQGVRISV